MASRVEGLGRLKRRLARITTRMRAEVRVAIDKGADELVAFQKRLAPFDDGILQDSIRKEPGRHDLAVLIRAGGPTTTKPVRVGKDSSYDYALAIEFGAHTPKGKRRVAQPFFFPAYRASRRRIKGRITRAVKKAVTA